MNGPNLFGGIGLLLTSLLATAQTPHRFHFELPTAPVTSGKPFPLQASARDQQGGIITNFTQTAALSANWRTSPEPVLSEITLDGETVEFTNPGDTAVDLGGWEVELLSDSGLHRSVRLVLPAGSTLPPRGVFTWSSRTPALAAWPQLGSDTKLRPPSGPTFIQLRDPSGAVREQVLFGSAFSSYSGLRWSGAGLLLFGSAEVSLSRWGGNNRFHAADWTTNATPSLGQLNPGLTLPWSGARQAFTVTPGLINFTNGVWSGTVTLQAPASPVGLVLDLQSGARFESSTFVAAPLPTLNLTLLGGSLAGQEAGPGPLATLRLTLPEPAASNLVVQLASAAPEEIAVPTNLTLLAGAAFADFIATNRDDAVADGRAVVSVTAALAGYQPAKLWLTNEDNETGELLIQLPPQAEENNGSLPAGGLVFLPQPATHDTEVELAAESPLQVPPQMIIRAGQQSGEFSIRVGDDAFVNRRDRQARVQASLPGWAPAVAGMRVEDNDNPAGTVELPDNIVEGQPALGRVKLQVARDHPVQLYFYERNPSRLVVPVGFSAPAGVKEFVFPLSVTDDGAINPYDRTELTVNVDHFSGGRWIELQDDEVDIAKLNLWMPAAAFSGNPIYFDARLVSNGEAPQRTNTTGRVSLLVSPELASLEPTPAEIIFTNGVTYGPVIVHGSALAAQFELSAAGFTNRSGLLDLFPGRSVAGPILDFAPLPGSGTLLLSLGRETNATGLLVELDPRTGQRLRELPLPKPAMQIAVSEDDSVAWLCSPMETIQRADLAAWKFDREFPLSASPTDLRPVALGVFPGSTHRVAVVIRPEIGSSTDSQLAVFEDGQRLPGALTANAGYVGSHVLPGRTTNEMFVQTYGELRRVVLGELGLTVAATAAFGGGTGGLLNNLVRWGDELFHGFGHNYSMETLERSRQFPATLWPEKLVVMPYPELQAVAYVHNQAGFQVFDTVTQQLIGEHKLPERTAHWGSPISRVARWGATGLATLFQDGDEMWLWESPLLSPQAADLTLTVKTPSEPIYIPMTNGFGQIGVTTWEFAVTNRGPGAAHGAQLKLESGEVIGLGSVAPGGSTTVTMQRGLSGAGILRSWATVTANSRDSNPADNTLFAETAFVHPLFANARQLMLATTDLAGSPAGDRLFATVTRMPGNQPGGVAVINPQTGLVEQVLPVGENPQRLAVAPDGAGLFVLLGTNQIAHWNLATAQVDASVILADETVLDFEPLPDGSGRLAIATKRRLLLMTGSEITHSLNVRFAEYRSLAASPGTLWMTAAGELRGYQMTPAGLTLRLTRPFNFVNGHLDFSADDRRLYFTDTFYDHVADNFLGQRNGDFFLPVPPRGLLYTSLGGAYDLDTLEFKGQEFSAYNSYGGFQSPDMVPWGAVGLAIRDGTGRILIYETSRVRGPAADLALLSTLSEPLRPNEPFLWKLTVTNHSEVPAQRIRLSMSAGPYVHDYQVNHPGLFQVGDLFQFDLGGLPAHGVTQVTMAAVSSHWRLELNASVVANLDDPVTLNNTLVAQVPVEYPRSDLSVVRVDSPARINAGTEFTATFTLTNRGPENVAVANLWVRRAPGLELLGTEPPTVLPDCCSDAQILDGLGPLAVGGTREVTVRFRAQDPGLYEVSGFTGGALNDDHAGNNSGGSALFVVPPATTNLLEEFQLPAGYFAWNEPKQQVLSTWGNRLALLSPDTLEPVRIWSLPGQAGPVSPTSDGQHAWVALDGRRLVRINLTDGTLAPDFVPGLNLYPPFGAFAAHPESSDLVVVMGLTESGGGELAIFEAGIRRPLRFAQLPWSGSGYYLTITPEGRIFTSNGGDYREFRVTAAGIEERRSLGSQPGFGYGPLSFANGWLFSDYLSALDVNALSRTALNLAPGALAADPLTGFVYFASPGQAVWGGSPMTLQRLRTPELVTDWRFETPITYSQVVKVVPLGQHGALFIGDKVRYLRAHRMNNPIADLALQATLAREVLGTNQPLTVQLTITNRSPWAALESVLQVEFSEGLVSEGPLPTSTNRSSLPLGTILTGTNLTLEFRTRAAGPQFIRMRVDSALDGDMEEDNTQELAFVTPPPPRVLVGSLSRSEGRFGTVLATLTSPAPEDMEVVFRVAPLTAQANDFASDRVRFRFSRGGQRAGATPVVDDWMLETDERFQLVFEAGPVEPIQREVDFTIVNDDVAVLALTAATVTEGNGGLTNARVRVTLPYGTTIPVDVGYQLVGATANPGEDFLARSGRLFFGPSLLTNWIEVPVVGDTTFEPAETLFVTLADFGQVRVEQLQVQVQIRNDDAPPAPVVRLEQTAEGQWRATFDSLAGVTYRLQSRPSLNQGTWIDQGNGIPGTGNPLSIAAPGTVVDTRFFRITAQ